MPSIPPDKQPPSLFKINDSFVVGKIIGPDDKSILFNSTAIQTIIASLEGYAPNEDMHELVMKKFRDIVGRDADPDRVAELIGSLAHFDRRVPEESD